MRKYATVALGFALLLSIGLRVWGSGFGLPAYTRYHPDEHALVERAAAILWTGDWNLHRFNYPALYAYLQAGAYAIYYLYGVTQELWRYVPTFVVPNYYLVGRLLTAACGTLTILVVYLAGRQLQNRRVGLLASALLATNYLHVIHSHYATFDITLGLLVSLTLLFSLMITDERGGSAKWHVLAGLCAGLAGATKYNGAAALAIPLAAHILVTPWGQWGWLNGRLALVLGSFLLGFFGGNPFALGNLPQFLNDLSTVLHHYGTEHPGFEGSGNWRWYPTVFLTSPDALGIIAGTIGLFGLLWKDWKKGLLVAVFPLLYYIVVSRFTVRFERNMVALLPFLAIGGGWAIDLVADWAASRFNLKQAHSHALAIVAALLLLGLPLTASVIFDKLVSQTDSRQVAGQWVESNIEEGSKIAIEHYAIPFDYDRYEVEDVVRISDHALAWYQENDFDVLIISDGVWEILRQHPEYYGDKLAVVDELLDGATLLAEFVPQPPGIVVAGYPTVQVYHFAPVRILSLSK
jgi:4-amino-4-deoxy-L-arabinose transferase-like glycosyltransferase